MKNGFSNITIIFYSLAFVVVWALFFAEQISTWGNMAITNGGLSGIEALLYGNLNLIIGFIFLTFIIAVGFVSVE